MISALNMLNAQPAEAKTNVAEASYAASQSSVAVVPLAIPLLTGPASMSTMVIFAERTQNMLQMVQLLCYAAVVAAAVYVSFNMAPRIARVMGRTGINVMTRLMGLILAAMSVEVVSEGLKKIFPLLAGS
jgi:multiple antibiotic resistance protein